jgi:hypothetical protein
MLTTQTRQSGVEPTSTQAASLSELDNIDVFDFFNLPRLSETSAGANGGVTSGLLSQGAAGLGGPGLPDPDSDWLRYGASYS